MLIIIITMLIIMLIIIIIIIIINLYLFKIFKGAPSTFETVLPFDIRIAGHDLVVWQSPIDINTPTQGWSVMQDICPHRLAPLSKGRVDAKSGCIECPYHGWQFATNGTCTNIPQLESDLQSKLSLPSTASHSLPVYLTEDMLWAFVSLPVKDPPGTPHYYPILPDDEFSALNLPTISTVTRDLPYSFDFLVENFMDVGKFFFFFFFFK
jgi:phenylpropionate dioxygenase-like ring-hydroxylating dioxygenase large terminal subunit